MEPDKFKESFKYFKSKNPPPDLSSAIEIDGDKNSEVLKRLSVDTSLLDASLSSVLKSDWDVFQLVPCPGVILIRNPFTSLGQRYFITKCLKDYARHPNPTNLQSKRNISVPSQDSSWWEELNQISDVTSHKKLREALRWTTLGYHHDWDTKVYDEKFHNDFPDDLKHLINEIAKISQFKDYHPEAAIVNFYPLNATLAGHTDHSEFCHEPLFSISFGQSAIFLIGGATKEVKPVPLLLQSGDVCVFTGQSRLNYHAVPKIIKIEEKTWWDSEETPSLEILPRFFDKDTFENVKRRENWKAFDDYVSECRININVRQVYKAREDEKLVPECVKNDNKKMKV